MWGVPGSHLEDPEQYLRVKDGENGALETYLDPKSVTYKTEGAIPLPVEPGSIVLLHGSFLHYSKPNTSDQQRHAYTLHVLEGDYEYSEDNWIRRQRDEICDNTAFRKCKW